MASDWKGSHLFLYMLGTGIDKSISINGRQRSNGDDQVTTKCSYFLVDQMFQFRACFQFFLFTHSFLPSPILLSHRSHNSSFCLFHFFVNYISGR